MPVTAPSPSTVLNAVNTGNTQDAARARLTQAAAQPQDPRAAEVAQKIDTLVKNQFGGDYKKAFQHYAGANGQVNSDGLNKLLGDANIGTNIPIIGTRPAYASALMDKFDANHDKNISWNEFTGGMKANGVNIAGN